MNGASSNLSVSEIFAASTLFDANSISTYLHPYSDLFPSFFSSGCLANEDDVYSPSNRPPVPPVSAYIIPRRKITNEDVLFVERAKEDELCALFRQDGYQLRMELYKEQGNQVALRYLRLWRLVNQHIPELYLSEGTRHFEPPEDALLAAIVEDMELGTDLE
jgi:hypothetical protein